jgi:metal-responsive CopG/Arc/MetJ family transcriptional regulator
MMAKNNKMKRVTVLLRPEDIKELKRLSDEKGIGMSSLIRMVVKEWIKENQQEVKEENE